MNCDIWSLGCLIYALITECLPFDEGNDADTIKATCCDQLKFDSVQWKDYSSEIVSLLTKMLTKDAEQRINI